MVNDNRSFELDSFGDVTIDGTFEPITNIVEYTKNYIKNFDIASVGVKIVYNNVLCGFSKPSGKGTMYNLAILFEYYKKEEL